MLIAIVIAIPLGVIAGTNRGTLIDNAASVVALLGISLPSFVIGPMLVYIFAVKLGWLAPSGRFDWSDIILPAFTLGRRAFGDSDAHGAFVCDRRIE